jgi:hypothetical protein
MNVDFHFTPEGNIWMLTPLNAEAQAWADDTLCVENWQILGGAIAIDQHYVDGLVARIWDAGFTVTLTWRDV